MSALQRPSTPRLSTSSQPSSRKVTQQLSEEIEKAIKRTTEGLSETEARTHRFLPKGELASILSEEALRGFFRELFNQGADTISSTEDASLRERDPQQAVTEDDINSYMKATIGSPAYHNAPRRALLALFLYDMRTGLLLLFKGWLLSSEENLPSDACMPFSQQSLGHSVIPSQYHRYIMDYQSLFKPVTIQRNQNQTFRSGDRLPYIGALSAPKGGSSGTVYKMKIAPYHWEVELNNGRYVAEETKKPTVVAIKVFNSGPTRQEAKANFEIERQILEDLRTNNYGHKMIMLDWGSISIEDEQHLPISHSLIFELATFSLADFFKDKRRAETYTTKSLLLKRFIGIAEAVACLHNNLKTLHLDIKPENILVFERGSSYSDNHDQDEHELVWKLTDFGLARKKEARQRTSRLVGSNSASGSSAIPATRAAGIYQAPEIQYENSSQAGQGSDVWSLGCVALMVLAYVHGGPEAVSELTVCLQVEFLDRAGRENLFYVRSDTYPWTHRDVEHEQYEYLENYPPVIGNIAGMPKLQAAVNPKVISWSNMLYRSYDPPEQEFIRKWLEVIFRRVFVIAPRSQRIKAARLCNELEDIQKKWNSYERPELASGDEVMPSDQIEISNMQQPSSDNIPDPSEHSHLCLAISARNVITVQAELRKDLDQIKRPCPRPDCRIHPIHMAIRNASYNALEALLAVSDTTVTDIQCPGSNNRTAIADACMGPGDVNALERILKSRDKFNVAETLYDEHSKGLNRESERCLRELCP